MIKNIILPILLALIAFSANAQKTPSFTLVTTEFSRGNVPNAEFIEIVVKGTKICKEATDSTPAYGDSIADLSHYVILDSNGLAAYYNGGGAYLGPGIASGKYWFPRDSTWQNIPYGTMIIIYNNLTPNTSLPPYPVLILDSSQTQTLIVPASSLELADSDSIAMDSFPGYILPSPPSFHLKNKQDCYLYNPPQSPYTEDTVSAHYNDTTFWHKVPADTIIKKVAVDNQTPGSLPNQAMINWRNQSSTVPTIPFDISLTVTPNPDAKVNPYFCPGREITILGLTNLVDSVVKYEWFIDDTVYYTGIDTIMDTIITVSGGDSIFQKIDTIFYTADSIVLPFKHNDKVELRLITSLKCINGRIDTVFATYTAVNVYPSGGNIWLSVNDSIPPIVDTMGLLPSGGRDSTKLYMTFCKGTVNKFSAIPHNILKNVDSVGPSDGYQWYRNGVPVSSDSTYLDSMMQNGDSLQVVITNSIRCTTTPTDTTTIYLTVLDSIYPPNITIYGDTSICSNVTAFFYDTITPNRISDTTVGYIFKWMVNGDTLLNPDGSYVDTTYKYIYDSVNKTITRDTILITTGMHQFQTGDSVRCVLYAHKTASCPVDSSVVSNALHMTVTQTKQITGQIQASQNGLCMPPVDTIIFNFQVNEDTTGLSPFTYRWYVDSVTTIIDTLTGGVDTIRKLVDSVHNTYTDFGWIPVGDLIQLTVSNNTYKCLIPDSSVFIFPLNIFNPYPPFPSATVTPNPPLICQNAIDSVFFSASQLSNYGSRPTYQWLIHDTIVKNPTDSVDLHYYPKAGDTVRFSLTSSVSCAFPKDTIISIPIIITPNVTPTISITAQSDTICQGVSVVATADTTNAGANASFTWNWFQVSTGMLNQIPTGNSNFVVIPGVGNGDYISCTLTSNANCALPATVTSDTIHFIVDSVVNILPIVGDPFVCVGATKPFSDQTLGGIWASSDATIAKIIDSANNPVTIEGIGLGNANITYTFTDSYKCSSSTSFTLAVTPSDVPYISGDSIVCVGSVDSLSIALPGGTWRTSDANKATVDQNGVVTGVANGAVTIYDSIVNDCGSTVRTFNILVGPPIVDSIKGKSNICVLNTTTVLTDSTTGGVWGTSDSSIAIVDPFGTVTAVGFGLDTITYTVTNQCGSAARSFLFTVGIPIVGKITGDSSICVNFTTTLSCTPSGGKWYDPTRTHAISVGSGTFRGLSVGSDLIEYIVKNSCGADTALTTLTVINSPSKDTITGDSIVCASYPYPYDTLSFPVSGGKWTSSNPLIASVDSISGIVAGQRNGFDTITYTVTTGCGTAVATHPMIVGAPIIGAYSFKNPICVNEITVLTNDTHGATTEIWSNQGGTIADIIATDSIIGRSPGTAVIYYLAQNKCGFAFGPDTSITVLTPPTVAKISGKNVFCVGDTADYKDVTPKGKWFSTDTTVARIDSVLGVLATKTAGQDTVTYTVYNASGCSNTAIQPLAINPLPILGSIKLDSSVCFGRTTQLVDTPVGGTWSSSNKAVATVNGSGVVSGITQNGTATITYSYKNPANGCTNSVDTTITVYPIPFIGPISGADSVCTNGTTQLIDTPMGGVWNTNPVNNTFASVSQDGVVSGLNAGTTDIVYTVTTNGCDTSVSYQMTVKTLPPLAHITCVSTDVHVGLSILLSDTTASGVWISSDPNIATVTGGVVTGVAPGKDTIYYQITYGSGCVEDVDTIVTVLDQINDLYVPNFLYPNANDPKNKTFKVWGEYLQSVDLKIFSQWGELMFQSSDQNTGWDGTYKGKEQPVGVYVYVATVVLKNGEKVVKKGAVNLIR